MVGVGKGQRENGDEGQCGEEAREFRAFAGKPGGAEDYGYGDGDFKGKGA